MIEHFEKVEKINDNNPVTYFEALSSCYFYKAAQYSANINLIEAGLFHRFDATNILKKNLASIVCSISKDHLDWFRYWRCNSLLAHPIGQTILDTRFPARRCVSHHRVGGLRAIELAARGIWPSYRDSAWSGIGESEERFYPSRS